MLLSKTIYIYILFSFYIFVFFFIHVHIIFLHACLTRHSICIHFFVDNIHEKITTKKAILKDRMINYYFFFMLVVNVKFELSSVLYTVCMYVCIFGDDRQIS